MTSNIGAQQILSSVEPRDQLRTKVMQTVQATLRPELLNRIDEIVVFDRLDRPQLRQIVELLLDKTRHRLRGQGVDLKVTEAAEDWLAEQGYQPEFGARPLRRTIQRSVDNPLSTMLLNGELNEGDTVTVDQGDATGLFFDVTAAGTTPTGVSETNEGDTP